MSQLPAPNSRGSWRIRGDQFQKQLHISVPIDGLYRPVISLHLLRIICLNGIVASAPAYRAEINCGRTDAHQAIDRAIGAFSNDQGFASLEARIEEAQITPASFAEVARASKLLSKVAAPIPCRERLALEAGDLASMFGIASISELSSKQLSQLASNMTVYELINLLTEISTHLAETSEAVKIDGFMGSLLVDDYDLAGVTMNKRAFVDRYFTKAAA